MTVETTQEVVRSSVLYEEATRPAPLPKTVAKSPAKKVAVKKTATKKPAAKSSASEAE